MRRSSKRQHNLAMALPSEADEILSKVSLFSDLHKIPEALGLLFDLMSHRTFSAGEIMIGEGDTGSDFFILSDGTAAVFKKTQDGDLYKVAILSGHAGTFFGEGGLLDSDTRTATIKAETECRCLVLSKSNFEKFCREYPHWALPILKRVAMVIMNRLKNMNRDMGMLYKALVDEFAQN